MAAALTAETTAAERSNRKTGDADAAIGVDLDESTQERPDDSVKPAPIAEPTPVTEVDPPTAALDQPVVVDAPVDPVTEAPVETEPPIVTESPVEVESLVEAQVEAPTEAPAEEPLVVEPVTEEAGEGDAVVASDVDQAVAVIPAPRKPKPRKKRTLRVARPAPAADAPRVLTIQGLVKRFGNNTAVDGITLDVRAGSFYGIVGPNGAGKTTTLSMVTGLLRPDAGMVRINDVDAWKDPRAAKRMTGVLPDRLRLFDRLTGAQLLYYSGALRGLDDRTVRERSVELIAAFGLEDAVDRLVADYSAGMTKKIALACAMIHAPRLLVLDEPFESVDPVSAANLTDILERYVGGGGTVLLSSHSMDLIERVCDSAAIIIGGRVLASGILDEVRRGQTLEDRFVELAGGRKAAEGMEWLHSFSD
ncbi:ATP-binding cassette domain-containing protein [Agromyces sp. NPDC049794]|uniref:ABC transporter ATP-binding protein n=1 Tax=unclassified Agromyces TaxID=2639701 RepID=UPI0033D02CCB